MLVMRRRPGESFHIGPEIEIEILEITPTRVKLGIVAPGSLVIVRKELVLTREVNLTASKPTEFQSIAWLAGKLKPAATTPDTTQQQGFSISVATPETSSAKTLE